MLFSRSLLYIFCSPYIVNEGYRCLLVQDLCHSLATHLISTKRAIGFSGRSTRSSMAPFHLSLYSARELSLSMTEAWRLIYWRNVPTSILIGPLLSLRECTFFYFFCPGCSLNGFNSFLSQVRHGSFYCYVCLWRLSQITEKIATPSHWLQNGCFYPMACHGGRNASARFTSCSRA